MVLAVCGIGLLETGAHYFFKNRAPDLQLWQSMRPRIASLIQRGDIVATAPTWSEPMARKAFGDELMPLTMVARPDDDGFARVLEIGILGQSRQEFATWPIVHHEMVGKFELSIRKNPTWEEVRYAAADHVDAQSLSIAVNRDGSESVCRFDNAAPMTSGNLGGDPTSPSARFTCPGGGIHWVGVTIIDDEKYRPRRCIWSPPSSVGELILRFHQVAFGKKLVGHAGAPWLMVRDGVGPPVQLSASTDKGTIGMVAAADTAGWIRFEWDTVRLAHSISDLELKLARVQGEQRFCFTLEAR